MFSMIVKTNVLFICLDGGKFKDTGEYWRSWYETDTFEDELKGLLAELQPLYANLHTFVKRKLKESYGNKHFPSTGHIPAHILGRCKEINI